jgi:hypothetical protein
VFAQIGVIDTPAKMQVLTGSASPTGWALDFYTTVASVQISVDGVNIGNAVLGGYRPDVCSAEGNYPGCPYVGWNISFDTTQFPDGPHYIVGLITTSDGRLSSIYQSFIVDNANLGLSNYTIYHVVNRGSGKGLDITGVDPSPGAILQQWTYSVGANQVMQFYSTDDGYFDIQMLHSLKAIGALNGTGNGSQLSQALYSGLAEQQWQLLYVGGGYYAFVNRASGRVLDLQGGSSGDGATIQLYDFFNNENQQWQIVPELNIPGGPLGWTGDSGSSVDYNLAPDDPDQPGEPLLEPQIAPSTTPCENDAMLYNSTTAGNSAGYDGLIHLGYGYTDASGRLAYIPLPYVKTAFDAGANNWNPWSLTTGFEFDPAPPYTNPSNFNIRIVPGNDRPTAGCSSASTWEGRIDYGNSFKNDALYDPPTATVIATHEFGHTMGLGEAGTHNSSPPSIMNEGQSCVIPNTNATKPTPADANSAHYCSNRAQGLRAQAHYTYSSLGGYSSVFAYGCYYYADTLDWYLDDVLAGTDPVLYSLYCAP